MFEKPTRIHSRFSRPLPRFRSKHREGRGQTVKDSKGCTRRRAWRRAESFSFLSRAYMQILIRPSFFPSFFLSKFVTRYTRYKKTSVIYRFGGASRIGGEEKNGETATMHFLYFPSLSSFLFFLEWRRRRSRNRNGNR